jgi:uncharacterized protein YdhG (YjbR/CyaY superfamily)
MAKTEFYSIDEYIAAFPDGIQGRLERISQTVNQAVPEGEELISYQMPTYRYHGVLVHFAVFQNHIGFFPTHNGGGSLQREANGVPNIQGEDQIPT